MKILDSFENALSKIFKPITTAALFIQMIIVFIGVIARYVFNSPQPWIDEISTYLLVVITYLGGYLALRGNKLAGITFIRELFPKPVQKVLATVGDAMIFILMAFTAVYGVKLCTTATVLKQKTPALQIPVIVFYCFVPISGFLMAVCMLHRIIGRIRGRESMVEEEGAYVE